MRKFTLMFYAVIAFCMFLMSTNATAQVSVLLYGRDIYWYDSTNSVVPGNIHVTATGGATPYTYQCYQGATFIQSGSILVSGPNSLSYVSIDIAGTYTVYVTDHNGLTANASIVIHQPSSGTGLQIIWDVTNINCATSPLHGDISVSVKGGYPTPGADYQHQYLFFYRTIPNTPYLTIPIDSIHLVNNMPTVIFHDMPSGVDYEFIIYDNNGCYTGQLFELTYNLVTLNFDVGSPENCLGNDGHSCLTIQNGTPQYTIQWNSSSSTNTYTITGHQLCRTDLSAGTYFLTVSDVNSCLSTGTVTVQHTPSPSISATGVNVNCFGQSTGTVNTNVTGGTSPYMFLWSNGATTQNLSGIAAGTYTVTVTDVNLCKATASQIITQPASALSLSVSGVNVTCFGQSTGSVSLIVTGGTSPYTYFWSNGATTQNLINKPAGTYSVTVTDNHQCTATTSQIITQPAAALAASAAGVDVSCYGLSTGSVTLTVTGGTSPYSYLWSNGAITQNLTSQPAGSYSVTVTDLNLCTATASKTLNQPTSGLSASTSKVDVLCKGNSTGSVTLTVSGGTTPYAYIWSNGETTQNLINIPAADYYVTITDHNGCIIIPPVTTILQPSAFLTANLNIGNVQCYGQCTGTLTVTPLGGTAPYSVTNKGTTITSAPYFFAGLCAGIDTTYITDSHQCQTFYTNTITQPPSAVTASATGVNILCYGNLTGTVTLTVNGGVTPYSYLWSNLATTQNLINLPAGTYSVTVTDHNLCTATATKTLTQPTSGLSASTSKVDVLCKGATTGSISLSVSGGVTPYAYLWSNGATVQNLINIPAGDYYVTITDNNGCVYMTPITTVSQPSAFLTANLNIGNVQCYGQCTGTLTVTPLGGTAPYSVTNKGTTITSAPYFFAGLCAGIDTTYITDSHQCQTFYTNTITQPPSAVTASATGVDILCHGNLTGSVTLTVSGGTTPYTYLWSNLATTQNLTNLPAGTYSVTVTDFNLCTATASKILSQPQAGLSASTEKNDVLCKGASTGSISLFVFGGVSPYSYLWSNGATTQNLNNIVAGDYYVTITDHNGCVYMTPVTTVNQPSAFLTANLNIGNVQCYGQCTGTLTVTPLGGTAPYTVTNKGTTITSAPYFFAGLCAGIDTTYITDSHQCQTFYTNTITQPPSAVTASATGVDILCHGASTGSVNLTVNGGVTPYSYLWSNNATTQNLTNLPAGTYSVTVTDFNLCTATASKTLNQPEAGLSASISKVDVLCKGATTGSINLSVSGGVTPYAYLWSNGATTQNLLNIVAGDYYVTITDHNGCILIPPVTTIVQPSAFLTANLNIGNVQCYGQCTGTLTVTPLGGTAPYSVINNGVTITAPSYFFAGLCAGIDTTYITDSHQCQTFYTNTITQPPSALAVSAAGVNILCHGDLSGSVTLTVTGGVAPYTYIWSNGAISQNLTNQPAGEYFVTVTDFNLCTFITSKTLTQPQAGLSASITKVDVLCKGASTGSISLTVSGGVSPYTYLWSNGATTQNLINIIAGDYYVTVTDHNNCIIIPQVTTIVQPAAFLTANLNIGNVQCYGQCTGTLTVTPLGGTAPYSVTNKGTTITAAPYFFAGLCAGIDTTYITDSHQCQTFYTNFITQPSSAVTASATGVDILCHGDLTGSVTLTVSGGTTPYTYLWSNLATTQNLSNLPAGTYSVTVTDFNLCTATATKTLNQPEAGLSASIEKVDVLCKGATTGSISLTVSGGVTPYNYLWSNGATTQNLTNIIAGDYYVTITDNHNCKLIPQVTTIIQPSAFLTANLNIGNVQCYGQCTGTLTVTPLGGTAPYSVTNKGITITSAPYFFAGLCAGIDTTYITDSHQCQTFYTNFITQPAAALAASATGVDILCYGNYTGSVTLTVTGGTTPYTYAWSNGATTQNLTNQPAGTYSVTVTDFNLCTATAYQILSQPESSLVYEIDKVDVLCKGMSTGEIDLYVDGGTPPYTFIWSNGATTQNLINIIAGDYYVTITDNHNCKLIPQVTTIIQPSAFLTANLNIGNIQCYGQCTGTLTVVPQGGTPPYTVTVNGVNSYASPYFFTELCAGPVTAVITDSHQCQTFYTNFITQPAAALAATATGVDILCYGNYTGSVTLTVTGGTTPYTYAWSNGATTQNLTNQPAGTYSVTVTDFNLCTATAYQILSQPESSLVYEIDKVDVLCKGMSTGEIDLYVDGGTPPYTFIWSNGATTQNLVNIIAGDYYVTITDNHNCKLIPQVTTIIQPSAFLTGNLNIGNVQCYGQCTGTLTVVPQGGTPPYTVTVNGVNSYASPYFFTELCAGPVTAVITDSHGCQTFYTNYITQPLAPLQVTLTAQSPLCLNGLDGYIASVVTGGTPPYSYHWDTGATTDSLKNLSSGVYCLTVTDSHYCTVSSCVTVDVPSNTVVALYITGENISCYGANDGWFEVLADGGAPPYQYSIDYQPFVPSPNTFTMNPVLFGSLTPGFHLLTIGDSNHCEVLYEVKITEPTPLTETDIVHQNLCYGDAHGSIDLTVTGGTDTIPINGVCCITVPYIYVWSNGATTQDISNLAAGTYTVTITDLHGCSLIKTFIITQPTLLTVTLTGTNVSCYGFYDGTVQATVTGGTTPYSYVWTPNVGVGPTLTNLGGNFYCVTVTDFNGCKATAGITITEPSQTIVVVTGNNVQCAGQLDGSVHVSVVSGLTAPLFYHWSNGATTENLNNVGAGTYCVTITDGHNCPAYGCGNVTSPNSPLGMNFDIHNVLCFGGSTGSIIVHPFGGTLPYYDLQWSGVHDATCGTCTDSMYLIPGVTTLVCCQSMTTETIPNLPTGHYYITLTDAYHCTFVDTVQVGGPTCPLNISNAQVTNIDLTPQGMVYGAVNIFVCCGTFPYTYYWVNQDGQWISNNEDLYNVPAGTYYVTVTDAAGCTTTGHYTVNSSEFPHWSYYNTGNNHTIYIPVGAVSGVNIGDYIGVFYDSLGTPACGGFIKWMGNTTTLAAWGEDGITPHTGFLPLEMFQWRLWKASTATEYSLNVTYNLSFPQNAYFVVDGLSGLTSLIPFSEISSQSINLNINWNLISTYLIPFNPNAVDVFNNIATHFIIAKDENGQVYWPSMFVNAIGNLTIGQAYRVKVNAACTLTINGSEVIPELTPLIVPNNWSFIGYLRKTPASIVTLMSPVVSDIIIMKNGDGFVYWPAMSNLNTIGNMVPGQGYQLKTNTAFNYTYPANGALGMTEKSFYNYMPQYYKMPESTGNNMTLGIPKSSWNKIPESGDEVGVFDSFGNLVGSGIFTGDNMAIAINGVDTYSNEIDGMSDGSEFSLRLWHQSGKYEEVLVVDNWQQGSAKYSEDGISVVGKLSIDPASAGYVLYQNIPNPFNQTTTIKFSIPESTHVTIGIYNLLGDLIKVIVSEDYSSGIYSVELNAKDYAAGSYFYKFETENFVQTKQLNIIK